PATGTTEVEVAHEELLRSWGALRRWLDEDREVLLLHAEVDRAAREWDQHSRGVDYLVHRGARRRAVRVQLLTHPRIQLDALQREYLDACQLREEAELAAAAKAKEEREQLRRRRMRALAGGLIATLIVAAVASWQWWEAAKRADENQRLVADQHVERAVAAFAENDLGKGLQYLAKGLEQAPDRFPEYRRDIRRQLANWHCDLHRLRAYWNHPCSVSAAAFSPDGTVVVTAGEDGKARLWSVPDGKAVGPEFVHGPNLDAVALSADGQTL